MPGKDNNSSVTPWISGNLHIRQAVLAEAERHAIECFPSECCGFMSGPQQELLVVNSIQRESNEADKYHKLDPERFPRTSRTYFKINELRASRAFEDGEKNGQPIKVIYHSHCNAGAYFSQEDAATFASEYQLMWPCSFLVISVVDGEVKDRKLWVHAPGSNEFQESKFSLI